MLHAFFGQNLVNEQMFKKKKKKEKKKNYCKTNRFFTSLVIQNNKFRVS